MLPFRVLGRLLAACLSVVENDDSLALIFLPQHAQVEIWLKKNFSQPEQYFMPRSYMLLLWPLAPYPLHLPLHAILEKSTPPVACRCLAA